MCRAFLRRSFLTAAVARVHSFFSPVAPKFITSCPWLVRSARLPLDRPDEYTHVQGVHVRVRLPVQHPAPHSARRQHLVRVPTLGYSPDLLPRNEPRRVCIGPRDHRRSAIGRSAEDQRHGAAQRPRAAISSASLPASSPSGSSRISSCPASRLVVSASANAAASVQSSRNRSNAVVFLGCRKNFTATNTNPAVPPSRSGQS